MFRSSNSENTSTTTADATMADTNRIAPPTAIMNDHGRRFTKLHVSFRPPPNTPLRGGRSACVSVTVRSLRSYGTQASGTRGSRLEAPSHQGPAILRSMNTLIIAASTAEPPGDDFQTLSYILLGIAMVVTAIATVIITPRAHHDDH